MEKKHKALWYLSVFLTGFLSHLLVRNWVLTILIVLFAFIIMRFLIWFIFERDKW